MPKTFKNLYPQVHSFENLYRAYRKARRGGKRKHAAVAAFEYHLEENLWALHAELRDRIYRPGPYRNFVVGPWRRGRLWAPKRRVISAAPFRDRVVHHALCNVIQPIFEARFIHDSYACRVGKGTHAFPVQRFGWAKDDVASRWRVGHPTETRREAPISNIE